MDTVFRLARSPYLHFREEERSGGEGCARACPADRGRRAARLLNPAPRSVDPSFYAQASFAALAEPVRTALKVILTLVPDRAADAQALFENPTFTALTVEEQRALLVPPKPERLDQAAATISCAGWYSLPQEKLALLSLDHETRAAMLKQLEHFPSLVTGKYFVELAQAPWFSAMSRDDRVRAAKIIAYASASMSGASFEEEGVSQKKIIQSTIESLLGETPRFDLVLADLPFEEHDSVLGRAEYPRTLVLNRLAIPADDRPISGMKQEHVALMTLVHEVNHLSNQIPEGPTYASFQDEYRAWFVAFVAFMSRLPTQVEGLVRVKELFTNGSYPDIQQALDGGGEEAAKIVAFMRNFGRDLGTRERILAHQLDNFVSSAPLPAPRLDMSNAGAIA
jgi:hypothetical protein